MMSKLFNFHKLGKSSFQQLLSYKKIILICMVIILPFVILEIWSINRLSTLGVEIDKMDNTASALQLENQVLANEIARRSSLITIESNAKILGFQEIKTVQQVQTPNLALGQ